MKRQFKAAAVVTTAALLAIGASFTSMAAYSAKTGTWQLEADGWYCLDKNGEAYTDEWCLSYGKEYFVDSDGLMATYSWIEDEDKYYFVGSTGAKTVNDWRYVTAFADEDGEEGWFYFDAKGEMVTGKKVIGGKTYYFGEDGKMLTGWVTYDAANKIAADADTYGDANLAYCDETGARLTSQWIQTWAPEVDTEEEEDYDQFWHYVGATGSLTKGKANAINGKTYLFDVNGVMLDGWVVSYDSDTDDDLKFDDYKKFDDAVSTQLEEDEADVYFCGTSDQGYVKKDRWVKTWAPVDFEDQDADDDQYWYLFGKDGKLHAPTTGAVDGVKVSFVDGDEYYYTASSAVKVATKVVGNKTYAFNNEGQMLSGLVRIESDANAMDLYYFGGSADGSMKTGNVTIADESGLSFKFYFGEKDSKGYKKGVAVTGAANKYLYLDGQLVTTDCDVTGIMQTELGMKYGVAVVNGQYYIINNNGAIQTSEKEYKDGSDVIVDTTVDANAPKDTKKVAFEKGATDSTIKGAIVDITEVDY